jgi:hypothetical protein
LSLEWRGFVGADPLAAIALLARVNAALIFAE